MRFHLEKKLESKDTSVYIPYLSFEGLKYVPHACLLFNEMLQYSKVKPKVY